MGVDSDDLQRRWEFGQLPPWDGVIVEAATRAARATHTAQRARLHPYWEQQTLRSVVPCRGTQQVHWRRSCRCITLGRLFGMLGQDFTAAVLYKFYRTRRIVVARARTD